MLLRGLSEQEVGAYISAVAGSEPSRELVARVYEETEGNPFFLSEVVNLMVQEGTINADSVSDIAIPDGVREAIGRRLNLLSEEANELLATAAVVGRDFPFETLQLLFKGEDLELVKLLDEGLAARVIEELEEPGRYQFTHAQIQETLLGEISTTRRVLLNGEIAEALEKRYGDGAEQRASRLARHYAESATLTTEHAEKALAYSNVAAAQAESQAAWSEAARHYEACLSLLRALETSTEVSEAEFLTNLGVCQLNMADHRDAWRSLNRAINVYRDLDDPVGVATATIQAMDVLAPPLSRAKLGDAALEGLAGLDEPILEGNLHARFFSEGMKPNIGQAAWDGHRRRLEEIVAVNPDAYLEARLFGIERFDARNLKEIVEGAWANYRRFAELGLASQAAQSGWGATLMGGLTGDLDRTIEMGEEVIRYAARHGMRFAEQNAAFIVAGVELARGQLDQCDKTVGNRVGDGNWFVATMNAMRLEVAGDLNGAVGALPDATAVNARPSTTAQVHAIRARISWNAGDAEAAREEIRLMQEAVERMPVNPDDRGNLVVQANGRKIYVYTLSLLDEGWQALEDEGLREAIRLVLSGEADYVDANHTDQIFNQVGGRSQRRALGEIALGLGLIDFAEETLAESLTWADSEGAVLEEGRSHLGLAELAARSGDRASALEHLDVAAELFQGNGLTLYLDRTIAKKLELQGVGSTDIQTSIDTVAAAVQTEHPDLAPQAAVDGTVTLMFSDIVDSTALNERLGDTAWMELLREHSGIVEREVAEHRGQVVKSMGDGFMVAFPSARDGVRCAIALQRAFASHNDGADQPIDVRIGLHTGEAVQEQGDFFGKHVNLAARIGSSAGGGEILVSSLLAQLVQPSGEFTLDERPAMSLKGLDGEHVTYGVEWR